jgi:HK97 family phage major capsid protein
MKIAQLESDLKAKQAEATALMDATRRACEEKPATATAAAVPERVMTAEERGAIQAKLNEAKALKDRITSLSGDAALSEEIARLTDGMAAPTSQARPSRTLGQQFIADPGYREWIKAGLHRRQGQLSPSFETPHWVPPGMQATTLTTQPGSGGALVVPDFAPGLVPLPTRRLVVADLIAPGTTDSNVVSYMKETTFTNAAAAVLEGDPKPESTLVFAGATAPVRKIAHWIPVTEEMLEDFAQTASIIDARLRLGLALTEEDELLNGSGVAPHLLGLMKLPGLTPAHLRTTESNADAIFMQMTTIATTVFLMPDGIVINPINWQTIQLTKNAQGNYMGTGPWSAAQAPTLWGVQVAVTPTIVANSALVGAYGTAAQIFRKGGVRVESSNSHASFFVNNLVAIRAEERLALAAYREAAFGQVTGLN